MTTSPGSDEGQRVICFPLEERLAQKLATQPVSVSPGEQAQLISEVQERFKEVSPHVLAELLTEIRSRSPHSDLESTAPVIAPLNPGTAAERSPSAPGLPRADVASPVTDQDRIANAFHIWEAPLADDAGRLERTLLDAGPGASAHTVSVGGDGMPAVSYAINDGRHVRWVDAGTGELTGPPLDDGRVASIALDAAGVVLNPPETLLALGESTVRLPGLRPGPEVLRALERTSAAEGSAEAQLERGGPGQHHAAATSPIATDGSSDAARPAVAAAGDREPLRPVLPQAFFDAPMRVSPVPTMDVGDGLESGPESGPESRVVAWSPAMEALAGAALAKMLGDHPVPENGSFATLRDAFHDLPEAVRKAPVHAVAQKVAERFLGSYNGLPGGAPASGWSYPAGGSSAAGWNAAGWINVSGGSSATGNASGQRPSLLPLFDPAPRRDFHENAQRLYHRVDRIADLKNDPQFMSALDAFMQNVNQNIWGVTTSVNEEAIGDLFSKLHRIRGTEVAYKWYVDHQNLGNFAYERDQKAADSVHQGHVWSKLNVWKSARREGILLETTIGGYLFNELKALGYGPAMQVLWGQLSHDYVTGLRGTITADILLGTTTDSVLTSTEWPILKQAVEDGKVTKVTFHVWKFDDKTQQWQEIQLKHVRTQRTFDELPPMVGPTDNEKEIRSQQRAIDAHEALFNQLDRLARNRRPQTILQNRIHRPSIDDYTPYPAASSSRAGALGGRGYASTSSRRVEWWEIESDTRTALNRMLGSHPAPETGRFSTLHEAFTDIPEAARIEPRHTLADRVAERFLGSHNGLRGGAPASGWSYPAGGSSAPGWNAAGWTNAPGGSSAAGSASGQQPSPLPVFDPMPSRSSRFYGAVETLYRRVDRISALKNNHRFMSALGTLMQSVNRNVQGNSGTISDLLSELDRIRGMKVTYEWYLNHQADHNFGSLLHQKAEDSVHQGHVWSKLNVWKSARREGILLETTIGGYLFNELKALGYGPAMQVLWGQLSHDYVTGLRGTVTADILLGTTTDSVLTSTEWPILKQAIVDGKVTEVVFHVWDLKPETNQWKEIQLRHVHTQRTFDELPPMIKAGDNAQEIRFRQKVIDAHEAFFYQLDRIAKAKPPRAILQTHVHRASVDEWTTRYPAARNPHIGFVFTGNMIEKGLRKALTEELQALNLNVGAVMSLLRALALNTKTGTDLTAQGPATEPATEPAPAAPGEVITDAPLWRPAPAVTPGTGTDLPAAGHPPAVPNRQMSDRDRIELAKILIENTYHSRREALESALKQLGQARENKANGVAGKCEEAVALALVGIAETQFVAAQSSWLKIHPTP